MINILYICTPTSIHDIKWMSFFSEKEKEYKVYAIFESSIHVSEELIKKFDEKHIVLLGAIHSFSLSNPIKSISSILKIRRFIRKYKINIFHVLFITPYAIWANFITCPYVLTSRGTDVLRTIPSLRSVSGIKGWYFKVLYFLLKKAIKKSNVITSTSGEQIDKFKHDFQTKNNVLVRTGVDVERINEIHKYDLVPNELKGQLLVFSPRFMSPHYNIEFQIDALSFLSQETIEKYCFVFIAGVNYNLEYYKAISSKLNELEQTKRLNYVILDYVDQEVMWMIYKCSELCIMTPISDGTPNSALEAMAARCPVIVSDLKYDEVLFEETCIKVDLTNSKELARKMELIFQQKPMELIEKAFQSVNLHGNRNIEMKKLEKIYQKIMES